MNKKWINIIAITLTVTLIVPLTVDAQSKLTILEEELKGTDRYETAGKIADRQSYTTAILVNSDKSLADGLSASGLSGVVDAPILLAKENSVPDATMKRLKYVKKVYIIGGTSAISSNIESQIKSKGISIERLKGDDRIKTSYAVAKEISEIKGVKELYFANGYKGEADAMSIGSVAAKKGNPIILTDGKSIPFHPGTTINYVVGGSSVMSEQLLNATNSVRLAGKDRFGTNNKVNKHFYPNADEYLLTKGWNLVDALTSSSLGKPIVFAEKGTDKSILKNANSLIRVGGIATNVYQECLNAIEQKPNRQPPVVTGSSVTIKQGEEFNNSMLGATATDCEGKAISVDISGKVDNNTLGRYTMTITATDEWGLTATKQVYVTVEEKAPEVTQNPNDAQFKAMVANEMYALVNGYRAANGVPVLSTLDRLEGSADAWSKYMADTGVFDHIINGNDSEATFPEFGERSLENIAMTSISFDVELTQEDTSKLANKLFAMWKNSSGHNAAILDDWMNTIGFGFYAVQNGNSWTIYTTQHFFGGTKSI